MVVATDGELRTVNATGPFGDPVIAHHGLLPGGTTAVMEMAFAAVQDACSLDEAIAQVRNILVMTARNVGRIPAMDRGPTEVE